MCDNTTAVTYSNKKGGTKSPQCNDITKDIWQWCIAHNLPISAAHIPGKQNIEANLHSRKFSDSTEWMLNPSPFSKISENLGMAQVDLFASRINRQISQYVSWKPEPEALAVDAFSIHGDLILHMPFLFSN